MDVTIIIVNWNSLPCLRQCLASIGGLKRKGEVIVIDSASFDGSAEAVRTEFPAVRFIQSERNLGFAVANNRAAAEASGDYLLFLNPDTEIDDGAVERLLDVASAREDAGVVGPMLLNTDRSIQRTCIRAIPTIANKLLDSDLARWAWPRSSLWGMRPLFDGGLEPREVEAVSGACLMLRRDVFESVGGFSEEFFMYAEDMDLAYKVRKAGFRSYYVPEARVVHHGGTSSRQAVSAFAAVMMSEATWRFFAMRRGRVYAMAYRVGMLCFSILRLLLLSVALPGWSVGRWRRSLGRSLFKWVAIFKWSIGRDGLVRRFYADPHA